MSKPSRFSQHSRREQRGVVLLSLILIVVAAASYVLIRGLNEASQNRAATNQVNTRAVLKEAKAALIGYSVSYPDIDGHASDKGPGRLPCPDYEYQGASDPIGSADSCSLGAGTETGLLPFLTIDTNEMFDASGARLWYAVSDNHRANAGGVINSDTPGTLVVDGDADIVAVIIAPGAALSGQNRSTDDTDDQYDMAQFLEGENATSGDDVFTGVRSQYNNDELITITRSELMAAAENRVLTTVRNALDQYFVDPDGDDTSGFDPDCPPGLPDCDDGYPWLAAFSNPSTSDFTASAGVREGHLPVVAFGRPFSATLDFQWDIPLDGTYTKSPGAVFDPNNNCARQSSCDITGGGLMTPTSIGAGGATCTWKGRNVIDCATIEIVDLGGGEQLEREYRFEFEGITTALIPPTASDRRQLNYLITGAIPTGVTLARITLTDNKRLSGGGIEPSGTISLELASADAVNSLSFRGIPLDLEIDHDDKLYPASAASGESTSPGELPAWFFEDEWHHLVVVSYAAAEEPGDPDADCSVDTSCLTLSWDRAGHKPDNDITGVRGIAVIAGPDLSSARPSATLADYFEDQNASPGDDRFARIDGVTTFNDQLRILNPND